jgi:hypothetical protein
MGKKKAIKKAIKKAVLPQGVLHLEKGFVKTVKGKMLIPGDTFTPDMLTPERLKELKEKGCIRGTLTTEQKGTITK